MATWFRCYSDIADNYKLKMLAYEDRWHYIALLSCKSLGMLDGKRPEFVFRTVAMRLGLTTNELEEVARRLAEYHLIEQKTLQPVGWDERQFISDNSTERSRKCRINKKSCNVAATPMQRNCNGPETDTETDTETTIREPKGFAEFWSAYPKKIGKGAAEKAWKKNKPPVQKVLDAIEQQKSSPQWTKDKGQFIPNPATWINQSRWEDSVQIELDTSDANDFMKRMGFA